MTQISVPKAKFATQLPVDVLEALRGIAREEGRQIQAVLDEALRQYIENRNAARPRKHVLAALHASLAEYDALYHELAK